jgi:hypothetical protein
MPIATAAHFAETITQVRIAFTMKGSNMNRRHGITTGLVVLAIGVAVADTSPAKRAASVVGPLTVYRDDGAFDPDRPLFELWGNPGSIALNHRELVNEFIRRPGAGVSRMAPRFVPQVWVELVPDSLSEAHAPKTSAQPPLPRYDTLKETLTLADGTERTMQERAWLQRDQRLMSVNAKSGPAVYVLDAKAEHELMKEKSAASSKNSPTRKLDEFETKALARLREDNDVVVQSTAEEMRVLGAIRARKECLECHKAEVGDLLGAFSYKLTLLSDATPDADCLKETAGLSRSVVAAVRYVESQGGKVTRKTGGPITEVDFTHTWKKNRDREGNYGAWHGRLKNSALAVLESFPELRVLDVSHSMVTDAGIKEIAKHKSLRKVIYTPGYITDAGIAEIKKSLPDCTFEMNPGAVLP